MESEYTALQLDEDPALQPKPVFGPQNVEVYIEENRFLFDSNPAYDDVITLVASAAQNPGMLKDLTEYELFLLLWISMNFVLESQLQDCYLQDCREVQNIKTTLDILHETRSYCTATIFIDVVEPSLRKIGKSLDDLFASPPSRRLRDVHIDQDFLQKLLEMIERNQYGRGFTKANKYAVLIVGDCSICLAENQVLLDRGCCSKPPCVRCAQSWTREKISQRYLDVTCPSCSNQLSREETTQLLGEMAFRLSQILVDINKSGSKKTCPNCLQITKKPRSPGLCKKMNWTVVCEKCSFSWCFRCHSPQHPDVSCSKNVKADPLVVNWSSEIVNGVEKRARQCPNRKCRALIEKRSGCSHMTCLICQRQFCYICLKRWDSPCFLLGDHSDKFSVFGCKQSLLPSQPLLRKVVRATVTSLRLLGVTIGIAILIPITLCTLLTLLGLSPLLLLTMGVCYCCCKTSKTSET